jgi:hypothetical protein
VGHARLFECRFQREIFAETGFREQLVFDETADAFRQVGDAPLA